MSEHHVEDATMEMPMAYNAEKPRLHETFDELRARIPGWGVDGDPEMRPSVPRLQPLPELSGTPWGFPARQPELVPRERSIEHAALTPVFGTSCPTRGLSGRMRRTSYRRYSEGQLRHWLLLMAADRVDVWEHRLRMPFGRRRERPRAGKRQRARPMGRTRCM